MTSVVLALIAGAVVGLSLGGLGGGGTVLTAPALIYLLGFSPQQATTAALVVVAATSATALFAHARAGAVRWRLGAVFAAAGVVPAVVVGRFTEHVPAAVTTGAFAVVAALAGVLLLRRSRSRDRSRAGDAVRPGRAAGVGAGLGALTGFLGVGGGFLAVPALVGVLAVPMSAAVGTSLLVITVNAVAAFGARLGAITAVDWALVGPFAAAALLGAWDGRRLAAKVDATALRRVFAAALVVVSVAMAADTVLNGR
ncbi:sulfite exporter TauE/SafE family protein [Saccharothrix obliqua]|uniref:sulfite exporter TauE/SafE family protein n=1 Tax=Saccharothrix obliqua TaxID=2861747 RepID=UPI001C5DC337|nr:sulfite exporter TauE/SafE family protein [Saccharothrix obliqua]MBW4716912.1 sulfite exporter TauE/SafE family protein [Saccharothrix obliqua]